MGAPRATLACLFAALVHAYSSSTSLPRSSETSLAKTVAITAAPPHSSDGATTATHPPRAAIIKVTSKPTARTTAGPPRSSRDPASFPRLHKAADTNIELPQAKTKRSTALPPSSHGSATAHRAPKEPPVASTSTAAPQLPSGTTTPNMELKAKVIDSVLVVGGIGAAAAVAGGVAAAAIHKRDGGAPLFLPQKSQLGDGDDAVGMEHSVMSATTTLTVNREPATIEMFPSTKGRSSAGDAQPSAVTDITHRRGSAFKLRLPEPAWMVVIGLGVIGGSLLLAGLVLMCFGRRKRNTRSWAHIAVEDGAAATDAEVAAQSLAEDSAQPEMPLLPPLPPLLPMPAPTVNLSVAAPPVVRPAVAPAPPARYVAVGGHMRGLGVPYFQAST